MSNPVPASAPVIADLAICGPFIVFDISHGHYIYQRLDVTDHGDIPPDIASLPVLGLRAFRDSGPVPVLFIETTT